MSIHFITGSKNKFEEVQQILRNIEQLEIDLPEIQDLDAHKIIHAKLEEALKHKRGAFIVEDTSLYLDALSGLPGPLIKWFLKTIGNEGLVKMAEAFGNSGAEAKTVIGYTDGSGNIEYFEGSVRGKIVPARGEVRFGWDPIFEPEGKDQTYAELTSEAEKNEVSMRRIAVEKLKAYLEAR